MPFESAAVVRRLAPLGLVLVAILVLFAGCAGRAMASHNLVSMIQDDRLLLSAPESTLQQLRQLGADQVRVAVRWQLIAPHATSRTRPRGFNATNPASYPAAGWAPFDTLVRDAATDGMSVNFNVVGGAPRWANGPGMPSGTHPNWEPSPTEFASFVRALGTRYSGHYTPRGATSALPRVTTWSIWNEPDYGPSLSPQGVPGNLKVENSPRMYRNLVNAAWGALHATGHGSDTILIGELAPRAISTDFGVFSGMYPLQFVRNLYCLDANYRPLRGTPAALRGCPTNAAGSRSFAAHNPVLFQASGFSDHMYMRWYPPNQERFNPRNDVSLATVGNLEQALSRAVAAYHSHKVFPIWNTEFGYITNPPKHPNRKDPNPWVSQATAAYYDNWAEYISWKDPRIMSFEQYLLEDPLPNLGIANDYGGFASGLLNHNGSQKPGYSAWRMPLYLPRTTASSGQSLEVWGAVKPVHYARIDLPYAAQSVKILFAPDGSSTYSVLDTIPINDPNGYFDVHEVFPSSGTVQLQWTYPTDTLLGADGTTVYSRRQHVVVR
jgi:hypothetical protein